MTESAIFSVIIPAYNADRFIRLAVASVVAQDYPQWEIIVVDDGSTDNTKQVLGELSREISNSNPGRMVVVSQENSGTAAARNTAIPLAKGDFLIFLDADDELLPDCMSALADIISENPHFDIYAFNAFYVYPNGKRIPYHTTSKFESSFSLSIDDMIDECQIYGASAFRKKWFHSLEGLDTSVYNEDYDFWIRAMALGAKHLYSPKFLALYRIVEGQKTANGIRMRESDKAILEKLVNSSSLNNVQAEHAKKSILLLEQNIAFRKRVTALLGLKIANTVFGLAHKAAWVIRPYRRK